MITKIGLCGATGRMGLAIRERISNFPELQIQKTFPCLDEKHQSLEYLCTDSELIIDFSSPILLPQLLECALKFNNKLIIGTTGFEAKHFEAMKEASQKIAIFYSANMSISINIISNIISYLTQSLDENYDIDIIDIHHRFKKDLPSGTALMLKEAADSAPSYTSEFKLNDSSIIDQTSRTEGTINISSIRSGHIVGTHEILFTNDTEIVSIKHQALNRNLFADGALKAAMWMRDQTKPGLYSVKDLLNHRSRLQ